MNDINIWCAAFWILVAFIAGLAIGCLACSDTDLD